MPEPTDATKNCVSPQLAHLLNPFDLDWPILVEDSPFDALSVTAVSKIAAQPRTNETSSGHISPTPYQGPLSPDQAIDVFGRGDDSAKSFAENH